MRTSGKVSTLDTIMRLTAMVLVATFILTVHYNYVQEHMPKIEENIREILEEVIPRATHFKPVVNEKGQTLYYEAFDDKGRQVGYGFIFTFQGMWNPIRLSGGVDLNYRLTGIKVLEQGETPGLGYRIEESWFQEQFQNLSVVDLKIKKYKGKVDAITGATTTSKIVTDAIKNEVLSIQKNEAER